VGSATIDSVLNQSIIPIIFFISFLGSFIKDLPDIEGDKLAGNWTLPVILSLERYKLIYAALGTICYCLLTYYAVQISLFGILIVIPGIAGIVWLFKDHKTNIKLFLAYYGSMAILLALIVVS
jgi:4-hydroxybenzoate polyprenyltransferase